MKIELSFAIVFATLGVGCQTPPVQDTIDLALLTISGVATGSDTPIHPIEGVEVSRDGQQLASVVITLDEFTGHLAISGVPLATSSIATPDKVLQHFGAPYWHDADNGEIVLFYERDGGSIELKFEFADVTSLAYITIARPGVLADPEQRSSYGVTKSWPPK